MVNTSHYILQVKCCKLVYDHHDRVAHMKFTDSYMYVLYGMRVPWNSVYMTRIATVYIGTSTNKPKCWLSGVDSKLLIYMNYTQ